MPPIIIPIFPKAPFSVEAMELPSDPSALPRDCGLCRAEDRVRDVPELADWRRDGLRVALVRAVPERSPPAREAPERVAPERVASEREVLERALRGRDGLSASVRLPDEERAELPERLDPRGSVRGSRDSPRASVREFEERADGARVSAPWVERDDPREVVRVDDGRRLSSMGP